MKRPKVRIGTLMLLVVIAALCVALVVERRKAATLLAEARAEQDSAFVLMQTRLAMQRLHYDLLLQKAATARREINADKAALEQQPR